MSKEMFIANGMQDPDYLGDSVYCGHDGYHIIICLNNGEPFVKNRIALEPAVIDALIRYQKRIFGGPDESDD